MVLDNGIDQLSFSGSSGETVYLLVDTSLSYDFWDQMKGKISINFQNSVFTYKICWATRQVKSMGPAMDSL